jgi:hypothetical protein
MLRAVMLHRLDMRVLPILQCPAFAIAFDETTVVLHVAWGMVS